jgi:hypothetical protein
MQLTGSYLFTVDTFKGKVGLAAAKLVLFPSVQEVVVQAAPTSRCIEFCRQAWGCRCVTLLKDML